MKIRRILSPYPKPVVAPSRGSLRLLMLLMLAGGVGWDGLAAGGIRPAQTAPVPAFPVKETRKEGEKRGEWKVTTEVRNDTTNAVEIVWWSWPAERGGAKIGNLTWYPAGTVSANADPNHPLHKFPARSDATTTPPTNPGQRLDPDAKASGEDTKSKEPHTTYVRVFEKQADGSWRQRNIVTHNIHLAAFRLPTTDPPSEYVSVPVRIPYPTDLADLTENQPAGFFIENVTLPEGWSLAFLAPGLEEKFTLLPHQREFSGILVARGGAQVPEGEPVIIEVTWAAEAEVVRDYRKTIELLLLRDDTPPTVTLQAESGPAGTRVTVRVQDAGGIHHRPYLTVTRMVGEAATTEVCVLPFTRVLEEDPRGEIGAIDAEFEITVRSPAAGEMLGLQASAMDQFGNAATSLVEVFTGTGIQGVSLGDGRVEIRFTGTLLQADEVTGPYEPVPGASGIHSIVPTGERRFFKTE